MRKKHSEQDRRKSHYEEYDENEFEVYGEEDEFDEELDTDEAFENIELEERGRLYAKRRRKQKHPEKNVRTWKDYVTTVVLIIAVCVLLFSIYKLAGIFMEYHEGEKEYKEIQKEVIREEQAEDGQNRFTVDFPALLQKNPDTAAWIRFDEPSVINYPVVYCGDNETYLTKTFEDNDNKLGALFIDAENKADMTDRNTIIYGHNMKNKTMFAELMEYKEKSYWSEHPYFYIYTPDGKETKYQIYAAGVVDAAAENYQTAFASDEEFQNYIYLTVQSSGYATGVEVPPSSRIVTLSTCTNVLDEERFVVHGVAVSEQ